MTVERIVANMAGSVRHDKLNGVDYLVAPMVMITEGVHRGSNGKLFYPATELKKSAKVWNHKPIVVYHPTENGLGISACEKTVLEKQQVGMVLNTTFNKGKLRAEAWLNPVLLEKVDTRVLQALETDTIMELSTGLYTENEDTPGEWNGETYDAIARNHGPDHLALLPDKIGACSVKDGAGLLQLNSGLPERVLSNLQRYLKEEESRLTENEVSFGNIQESLWAATQQRFGTGAYVRDVYADFCIVDLISTNSGLANKQPFVKVGYTVDANGVVVLSSDSPVPVVRVTEYRTVDGSYVGNNNPEPRNMSKEQLVDALIANSNGMWTEAERSVLLTKTEDQLKSLGKPQEAPTANAAGTTTAASASAAVGAPAAAAAPATKPLTTEEYITNAPPEVQELLNDALRARAEERQRYCAAILANNSNPFSQDELSKMSADMLAKLAKFNPVPTVNNQPQPQTYFGMGGSGFHNPTPTANAEEEAPLPMPSTLGK